MMEIDYGELPPGMQDGFRLYIEKGIPMGSFGQAVVSNDLMGAFGRADATNRHRLFDICVWLRWSAPNGCHGNPEIVRDWMASGGLEGLLSQTSETKQ